MEMETSQRQGGVVGTTCDARAAENIRRKAQRPSSVHRLLSK
jgi:hypothetical protein